MSPGRAAASIGVGLFVGCLPVYGAQFLIVLAVCMPLRLDAALAYLVSHVSNPLTLPLFLWLELEVGSLIFTGHRAVMRFDEVKRLGLAAVGAELAVGALVCGVVLASLGAVVAWGLGHRFRDARQRELAAARRRTLTRYASAPRAARSYVAIKLRTDPALEAILGLEGNFGRVVDAGCGFLQIGLCLLELGRAVSVHGLDADAERIDVARAAAGSDARVERADLVTAEIPSADTVLFVDSLHYLPLQTQDELLARATAALAPGGRVIVREVDSGASMRSRFTERLERNAARKRRRAQSLFFRPASEIRERLEALGLECTIVQHDELSIVHNALVVGRKVAAS
jgi:uncharacterized protein (DUF2062 family)/precorrin-6B methylase 2